MGRDKCCSSGYKRVNNLNTQSKCVKDENPGPSSKRGSKDRKSHFSNTVNIADKNKTNNKKMTDMASSAAKVAPARIVLARASVLKAKPENNSCSHFDLTVREKFDLEKIGYIISKKLRSGDGFTSFSAHYLKAGSGALRRKYDVWAKVIDVNNEKSLTKLYNCEIPLLSKLDHRNVVKLHSILEFGNKICVFTTGSMYGSVLDFLSNHGPLFENHGRIWFRQILNGLEYLYTINVSHRDLNCEALFIGMRYNLQIGDFESADFISSEVGENLSTYINKSLYSAPEVLLGESYNPKIADMWSLGVILYSFYLGHPPFRYYGNSDDGIAKIVLDQLRKNWLYNCKDSSRKLSAQAWSTICALLEPDVLKRATPRLLKQSSFYSMKECICGFGSFKSLTIDVLGSLPDLYDITKSSVRAKNSEAPKSICPAFKDLFRQPELSLKIEDMIEGTPSL